MNNFSNSQPRISFLLDSETGAHGAAAAQKNHGGSYVTTNAPKSHRTGSYVTSSAPREIRPGSYVTTDATQSGPVGRYTSSALPA